MIDANKPRRVITLIEFDDGTRMALDVPYLTKFRFHPDGDEFISSEWNLHAAGGPRHGTMVTEGFFAPIHIEWPDTPPDPSTRGLPAGPPELPSGGPPEITRPA